MMSTGTINKLSATIKEPLKIREKMQALEWRLAELMSAKKLDYKSLAELTGFHPITICKLKNNLPSRIEVETLVRLCQALDCQPGDLLVITPGEPGRKKNQRVF